MASFFGPPCIVDASWDVRGGGAGKVVSRKPEISLFITKIANIVITIVAKNNQLGYLYGWPKNDEIKALDKSHYIVHIMSTYMRQLIRRSALTG